MISNKKNKNIRNESGGNFLCNKTIFYLIVIFEIFVRKYINCFKIDS